MAVVLAILGAALGVFIGESLWAGLSGGALGFLLAQSSDLKDALTLQGQRLRKLEAQSESAAAPAPTPAPAPTAATPAAIAAERESTQTPPPDAARRAAPDALLALVPNAALRFLRSGGALTGLGVLVLFFGVGFLVKYAVDHAHFPIWLRLLCTFIGGLIVLALGLSLRQRRRNYGLLLQGGGIGILYLTIFAAYRLYALIPAGPSFATLALIALCGALLAVRQNALTLATLGAVGGFLAPVLASTGSGAHIALFSYYLVLNLGIFAVAWFRAWRVLNLVGFVFTFGIGSLWGYRFYAPEYWSSTEPFLLASFALYTLIPVLFAFHQPPRLKAPTDGTLVFGTPLVVVALQAALVSDWRYGLALSALGFGLYYLILAGLMLRLGRAAQRRLVEAFVANGVVLLTLAAPFAFEARPTSALWALEGAAIVWVGIREGRLLARSFGVALQALAGVALVGSLLAEHGGALAFVFNREYYLGTLLLTAAALCSALLLRRAQAAVLPAERTLVVNGLLLAGAGWWLVGGISELLRLFSTEDAAALMLIFFAASAAAATIAAKRLAWAELRIATLGYQPLLWLGFVHIVEQLDHPFAGFALIPAWLVAIGAHFWLLWRLEHDGSGSESEKEVVVVKSVWLHAGLLWLLAAIVTTEVGWQVQRVLSATWEAAAVVLTLALLLLLTSRYGPRLEWPIGRHLAHYRSFGLAPLALLLFALLLSTSRLPGDPAPWPYLPLLNPVDSSSLVALFGLGYFVTRADGGDASSVWMRYLARRGFWWIAGAAFLWLNVALFRVLHFFAGTPFTLEAWRSTTLAQTTSTMLWASLSVGAMLFASRRKTRDIWFSGAGLMVVVVLKLFSVDLSSAQTISRFLAFLVVGLLLLLVGYFSPLPPRKQAAG